MSFRCPDLRPWFLRAAWRPDVAMDLYAADGKPDHGKAIGMFAFIANVFLILYFGEAFPRAVPLGHFIGLNSTIYGWLGWRTFLKSRTVTATEHRSDAYSRNVSEQSSRQQLEIVDRRELGKEDGTEPSP